MTDATVRETHFSSDTFRDKEIMNMRRLDNFLYITWFDIKASSMYYVPMYFQV
jgi:hypothetical protein